MTGSRRLYLTDTASGAPYFALRQNLREGMRWRRVDYYEILAVVGGEGRLISYPPAEEPRIVEIHPGTLLVFRPGEDPLLSGVGPDGVTLLYVSFPAADWRAYLSLAGLDFSWARGTGPLIRDFDAADEDVVRPFTRAISRLHEDASSYDLVQFWVEVTPHLFPAATDDPTRGIPHWLVECVRAMHEEDNLRGGIDRLLSLAHVSAPHLARSTQRYLGTTPTALVTELRLRHAAVLLTTTREPIGAISERCGFTRLNYFSTCFRRIYGVTPRAYRDLDADASSLP